MSVLQDGKEKQKTMLTVVSGGGTVTEAGEKKKRTGKKSETGPGGSRVPLRLFVCIP